MTPFNDLLGNLAIVALSTSAWTFGQRHIFAGQPWVKDVAFGVLMALGTAAVMALPFEFKHGIFLDLRYTFLAVSAFYGGPIAAILCLVTAAVARIAVGGTGLSVGLPLIAAASLCGFAFYKTNRRRIPSMRTIFALSTAVAISGTLGFFVKLSFDQWSVVMPSVVAPFGLVLFASTALASTAVMQEMKRQAVSDENRMYRAVIEALPDCLNAKGLDGRFLVANPATAALMNAQSAETLIGTTDFDYYAQDTAATFRDDEAQVIKKGKPLIIEQKFRRADGKDAWLLTLKSPLRDENGSLVGLITHNREITEQKLLEQKLARTQAQLADAISSMADGLVMFDEHGVQLFHNSHYLELFPLTADVRQNGNCLRSILRAAVDRGEEQPTGKAMDEYIERTAHALLLPGDRQIKLADGRWIQARTRRTSESGHLIMFSDITRTKGTQEELKKIARTDGLTGVLNRRAFDEELETALLASGADASLLILDIDYFKRFNDTYGHPAGDVCLKKVAQCLSEATASLPGRVLARYGGEEFALILPSCDSLAAQAIGELIVQHVRYLGITHGQSPAGVVTVSVGVATATERMVESKELLRLADEALYVAKAEGRNRSVLAASINATSKRSVS